MSAAKFLLHESLGYRMSLVARMLERVFDRQLAELEVSRGMWAVLLAVGQEGYSKPSEIAEFVGIDRTAVSRLLRTLENRELVRRANAAHDGRAKAVTLTTRGRAVLSLATAGAHETARWYKAKLTQQEQSELDALLNKLLEGEARDVPAL